jgi:hypothetical protein
MVSLIFRHAILRYILPFWQWVDGGPVITVIWVVVKNIKESDESLDTHIIPIGLIIVDTIFNQRLLEIVWLQIREHLHLYRMKLSRDRTIYLVINCPALNFSDLY